MTDPLLRLRRLTRVFLASATLGFATHSLTAQDHGVLREVWSNLSGNGIERLLDSPNFPSSPTLRDLLPDFASPPNFASNYGTRLRAYLTPELSGEYTFWIQGDDYCVLYFSADGTPESAELIASVPGYTSESEWDKFAEQRSAKLNLTAGETYYLEALHKEGGGTDFVTVNWDLDGAFERSPIPTSALTPFDSASAYDPNVELYIEAGEDRDVYLPAFEFQLNGSAFSRTSSTDTLSISWTQISGFPTLISAPNTLTPTIIAQIPGTRTYRLSVSNGSDTKTDTVTVTVHDPLARGTGSFNQEIWLGVDGSEIAALLEVDDFPSRPHLIRKTDQLIGPRHWGDRYGARTKGLITPPKSGSYTFYVMGDDAVELHLSDSQSPDGAQRVAFTPEATKENNWTQFPEQSSESIYLEKGRLYYLELLFATRWGGDYHGAAWSFEGGPIETIGGECFVPETPSNPAPNFNNANHLVVEAGPDRHLFTPDRTAILAGKALRYRDSFTLENSRWSQVSGPAVAQFSDASQLETIVDLPQEGTYVFNLTVVADGIASSDTLTVTRAQRLAADTGGFTREVWTDLSGGSVEDLLAHPEFPDNPSIIDQLPSLAGPINWDTRYGSRATGYLIPDRSGAYTFYLSADDSATLNLSTDASPANLRQIASSGRRSIGDYRDPSQISDPVSLEAGQRYYIEVLHKQHYGDDHFQVSWSFGDENAPTPIGGGNVVPSNPSALPLDPTLPEYAWAGPDRHYYAPTKSFDLIGEIFNVGAEDYFHRTEWTYAGDSSGVAIEDSQKLATVATVPGEGTYIFRLTLQTSGKTHYDDVAITILPPLSVETGGITRSVWLDVDGSPIESLLEEDPLLENPTFEDIIPSAEPPYDWTDNYGTRLIGYIHPPASGDYQFWIAANDMAELRISSTERPEDSVLVAEIMQSTYPRDWDRREEQASVPLPLEAGKKYFVEAIHKESAGSDHLAVAWAGPGLNPREVITAGYLSPAYEAPAAAPEILILPGEDLTLRWPASQVDLHARVYDQIEGPETLAYQWSASQPDVLFSSPEEISTQATFPGPGNYTISITASDGAGFVTASLRVSVYPPLSENAGSITREVWLNVPGYRLQDLLDDQGYPNGPDIVDTIDSFDLPRNWADYYGTRVRGYLIPPATGDYQFFVAADDYARVSINTASDAFEGLTRIIDCQGYAEPGRWDRREDQTSETLRLLAGKAYPIEMLHREKSGGDHAVLAWRIPGSEEIVPIDGAFLAPSVHAPSASKNLIVIAPYDVRQRWPQNTVSLRGKAFDQTYGPESLSTRWEKVSGPGKASFDASVQLDTNVHLSLPGEYRIRLYANDGKDERFDEMTIILDDALSIRSGAATRSVFSDISGGRVIDLVDSEKFPNAPDSTEPIPQLDSKTDQSEADRYGTLVSGFLHPPASGAYRFSVSGDDWAEIWLSSDESPERKTLICFTPQATAQYEWDLYPDYQTSAEIELKVGRKYYIEIRHKEHSWRDHFSVAWLRPDLEEMQIIEGAYLSPVDDENEVPDPDISIRGMPTVTLNIGDTFDDPGYFARDSEGNDISEQVVVTNHVDSERAGAYSVRYQVVNPSTGFAETVVRTVKVVPAESHPALYPDPSHRPPLMVDWDEPAPGQISASEASRFLAQATFGPTAEAIAHLQSIGYSAWIDEQLALEPSLHMPDMLALKPALEAQGYAPYAEERLATWWTQAITAPDQLRQRVAFALSEIFVISDKNSFNRLGYATANYYDILVRNALEDYRSLLHEVTLNPMMGQYLTMLRSDKASPDENYAREVLQLFSIGLILLNPDGTPLIDSSGSEVPTYDNELIIELARAFTGWTYAGSTDFHHSPYGETDYLSPMVPFDEYHDFGAKTLTGGFTLPQGLSPTEDVRRAIKHIADHPNVGPFIGRRLIQRLVTSNPSPGYIYRIAKVFENDGTGRRGNLGAVVKAILLDPEARDPGIHAQGNFGKLREPVIRLTHLLRSFNANTASNPPVFGRYPIANTSGAFGQAPLQAPSVFNFFQPDYAPPGPLMDAGLVAPEFDITTEITTVDTANFLHDVIDKGTPTWWRYSTRIRPNLTHLFALAADSDAILDELDTLLMSGAMTAETRAIIKSTIDEIEQPERRVDAALKLVVTSPEFSVLK